MLHWGHLAFAIVTEVAGTVSMKLSDGMTKTLPAVLIVLFYGMSFYALSLALRKIDVGTAYALWAGAGTALIAIVGMVWFKESVTVFKLVSPALIIAGVVGLQLSSPEVMGQSGGAEAP